MIGIRHPLWRKAPTRLVRRPALLAAVMLGALLVTVVSTAYPLFLSASDSNILASTLARPDFTRYGTGLEYRSTDIPLNARAPDGGSLLQERRDALDRYVAADPRLGPAVDALLGPTVGLSVPNFPGTAGRASGRLFAGTDALEHVEIVSGSDGDGVWLSADVAKLLNVHPGDTIQLDGSRGRVSVGVDGTYAPLADAPPDGYWQIWHDRIHTDCIDCSPYPQFIIADAPQLISLQTDLHERLADQAYIVPLRASPPLTLDDLHALRTSLGALQGEMQDQASYLGHLFPCCTPLFMGNVESITQIVSLPLSVVSIVEARSVGLRGPAIVLLFAGLAIALVVVSSAGVFSYSSRPTESALLSIRGWGPLRVAGKAAVESALPVAVGAFGGFCIADVLVRTIGPDGPIAPAARVSAILGSAAAALVALAVIAAASAVMFAAHHERKDRLGRVVRWLPWELVAFAALISFGHSLHAGGGLIGAGDVRRPGAPVFLYPIALASLVGILVARATALAIVWRARVRGRAGVWRGG